MNKNCTSLEQSKKLIELGIDVNTADMFWDTLFAKKPEAQVNNHHYIDEYDDEHKVPAWSLSALLDLLPSSLSLYPEATEEGIKEGKYRSSDLIASKEGYLRKRYDGDYQYRYDGIKVVGDFQSSLDATFEMVCWLLENKKI